MREQHWFAAIIDGRATEWEAMNENALVYRRGAASGSVSRRRGATLVILRTAGRLRPRPVLPLAVALFLAPLGGVWLYAQSAAVNAPASQPAQKQTVVAANADATERWSGGLLGSKHDFSQNGAIARDLCLPCHTPHISNAEAPLLVRKPAASQPTRSYRTAAGELNEASLVCLSCHDGTVAPDVFAGSHAATWSDASAGGVIAGRPRLTSHPVGIAYPVGKSDYRSAEEVTGNGGLKLAEGKIQCTTCHDPHNTQRHAGMLVISNERSRLCLTCHKL